MSNPLLTGLGLATLLAGSAAAASPATAASTANPLLECVSSAPLGRPVVPEV